MFTGIIEATGTISSIETEGGNVHFFVKSEIASELKVDQSVAHNGVCLTVVGINEDTYKVTAINETLKKTNLGKLKPSDKVNLERSMASQGRFDGHVVQGHVDQVAICNSVTEQEGSYVFRFNVPGGTNLIVEKGSICINGVSLTCFNVTGNSFEVAIIPFTFEHTNINQVKEGVAVNIEFDILGKYVQKMMAGRN
ncbi:Riboflavin synthase eubacterial/eukaryotic [hydrothermal vent metagenome]|uniref:Riboflavin synthase n=1 Tax=hydrothermal vent metagenome TaxID=652676 RepID=A0A3B0WA59_9ZZZZ